MSIKNSTSKGFSLIELIIVVAMVGILVAVAIPNLSFWIAKQVVIAPKDQLFKSLQYARTMAIERNLPYLVCASTDGATCATATDWSAGWIIAQTDNATGAGAIAGIERVITIDSDDILTVVSTDNLIQFWSTGRPDSELDVVLFCHGSEGDVPGQGVQVTRVGRAQRGEEVTDAWVGVCPAI